LLFEYSLDGGKRLNLAWFAGATLAKETFNFDMRESFASRFATRFSGLVFFTNAELICPCFDFVFQDASLGSEREIIREVLSRSETELWLLFGAYLESLMARIGLLW
jgi:hypothetical protein